MHRLSLAVLLLFAVFAATAQDDEDSLLDLLGEEEETQEYVTAGFKTTRIINGHSFEMNSHGVMDFKISHRFGRLNGGAYELFGLDQANVRIGFDYGLTDWLNIGVGRTNVNKTFDGFVKLKFLRQQKGKKNIPLSMLLVSDLAITSLDVPDPAVGEYYFSHRMNYTHQLIIGRKFSESLSLQVMPTVVHRNFVESTAVSNDVFIVGVGGRQKLTKRLAVNVEYYYTLPDQLDDRYTNSLSVGLDIETGGHVFQLHLTNSRGMTENLFLTETDGVWGKGDIHFGFNVSRVFTVYRPKKG